MPVNATAVWRVRPGGSNTNGGGYDPGIAGAGTDYSKQNAAQVTQSGGTRTTSTVTLTDSGATFTSALIGNGIRVAGTGITSTFTFITAIPSNTTLTLQTSPGTAGSAVTYSIGGAWADFWTNINVSSSPTSPVVPGNTVYILGLGISNPSSYTIDYAAGTSGWSMINGNGTAGDVTFAADPATPGYTGTTAGGMPTVSGTSWNIFAGLNYTRVLLIWSICIQAGGQFMWQQTGLQNTVGLCVFDMNGEDGTLLQSQGACYGCEFFSSVAAISTNASFAVDLNSGLMIGCNIHNCIGPGIVLVNNSGGTCTLMNTIIAKNGGDGLTVENFSSIIMSVVGNTIDGNTGHGINVLGQSGVSSLTAVNNIISNHTGGGKFGLIVGAGTATQNSAVAQWVDYNTFYNNTGNYSGINAGAHDTALSTNPYVGQTTENYALA